MSKYSNMVESKHIIYISFIFVFVKYASKKDQISLMCLNDSKQGQNELNTHRTISRKHQEMLRLDMLTI